jgi:lysophospholipase L1-like esterase
MSARRALSASSFLLLLAACGGASSPTGPGPSPSAPASQSVSVVVFYDENGNGLLDAVETVRIPDVEVTIGGRAARSVAGTGRAVIAGVASGSFTPALTVATLPPYYAPGRVPSVNVPVSGDVAVPVVLPIGPNRPNTYMAFGDSITEGNNYPGDPSYREPLQDKLRQYFGRADVLNEGVGSTKSNQGADRVDGPLNADRPAYTLILYGTNDWNQSVCKRPDQLATTCFTIGSLRDIVLSAKGASSLPVLATIPPCNENFNQFSPPQRNAWVSAADVQIRDLARQQGVPLADVEPAFLAVPDLSSLFVDHVHPNAAGEEIIARTFFEAIAHGTRAGTAFTGPFLDLDAADRPAVLALPRAPAPPRRPTVGRDRRS